MKSLIGIFICLAILIAAVIGLLTSEKRLSQECKANGGDLIYLSHRYVCISKGTIIHLGGESK